MKLSLIKFLILIVVPLSGFAQKKSLNLDDIMKIPSINRTAISDNGNWMAFSASTDRGDGFGIVKEIAGRREYRIERASSPIITPNGSWAAFLVLPSAIEIENAARPADRPKNNAILIRTSDGQTFDFENVQNFSFSGDGYWIAIHHHTADVPDSLKKKSATSRKNIGTDLVLRNLQTGTDSRIPFVTTAEFDSLSVRIIYTIADTSGNENGLYYRLLNEPDQVHGVHSHPKSRFGSFAWHQSTSRVAFLTSKEDEKENAVIADLMAYDFNTKTLSSLVLDSLIREEYFIPFRNILTWTDDGARVFFGFRPASQRPIIEQPDKSKWDEDNFFDFDRILKKTEVDVWHGEDPLIKTHEKQQWNQNQNRTFLAVYHLNQEKWVPLANNKIPNALVSQNPYVVIASSNLPYRKEITWVGNQSDYYLVDLKTGEYQNINKKQRFTAQLSPDGNFVVYFNENHWHVYNRISGSHRNLTIETGAPFFNEDDDRPAPPGGYGIAGWIHDNPEVMIYDKYDLWKFNLANNNAQNLTAIGRENGVIFRVIRTDINRQIKSNDVLFLSSYHDTRKNHGFYSLYLSNSRLTRLLEEPKRFRFVAKASNANRYVYSRESYDEYPDLWTSDDTFRRPQKITNLFPAIRDYAWGNAELIDWISMDGTPVQGVLIKPGNYQPGQKYPVVVYFYELFSQRMYDWNQQVVNHRPSFPFYASHGYAIFLPDIRYTIGQPGYSATKYILPGVQKLIEMGIADPQSIGLHGHSWSGYQAAHMVTQTDIFAAVVTGAPVSNMTSAYTGIRWGSGMARLFQYEQGQSRLSANMWERRDLYIENSPVFFADRINTPMLIMFGDEDDAVPWYQGIELYLAMRRLGKDVIFLQYRGEPHHPQKYANKLDYSIRMKEYFDHYLKKESAADWIINGVPFSGY